jgi:hypothetical protein
MSAARIFAAAAISVAFAAGAGPARAKTVTLECELQSNATPHEHSLFDIDYAASTVRTYWVDDDGAPIRAGGEFTFPVTIDEKTINWTINNNYETANMTLGRYSGNYTVNKEYNDSLGTHHINQVQSCHPWTSPSQQRKF